MTFRDRIRAAAGAAASVLRETTPKAIEKLEEAAQPTTDFERKLDALGVVLRPTGAEATALAAIEEAQTYALDLASKLAAKQRTIDSLQDDLIRRQEDMQAYVAQGADDQMFYLTEFLQQRFANDFQGNEDVVEMSKRLLRELHERRQGKLHSITREKFLITLRATLAALKSEVTDGLVTDHVEGRLFAWNDIRERVKRALGIRDADDMRVDWLVSNPDIESMVIGAQNYYGLRELDGLRENKEES